MNFIIKDIETQIDKYLEDTKKTELGYTIYIEKRMKNYFNSIRKELKYQYSIFLERQNIDLDTIIEKEEKINEKIENINFDNDFSIYSLNSKNNQDINQIKKTFYDTLDIRNKIKTLYTESSFISFMSSNEEQDKKELQVQLLKNCNYIEANLNKIQVSDSYIHNLNKIISDLNNYKIDSNQLKREFNKEIEKIKNFVNDNSSRETLIRLIEQSRVYLKDIIMIYKEYDLYSNTLDENSDTKVSSNTRNSSKETDYSNIIARQQALNLGMAYQSDSLSTKVDNGIYKENNLNRNETKNKIISIKIALDNGETKEISSSDLGKILGFKENRELRKLLEDILDKV